MSEVTQSFFHLLRTNNGYWKSFKQGQFLLSQCQFTEQRVFAATKQMYNNSFQFFFYCDAVGVVEVRKVTKNKEIIWWKRNEDHEEFLREKAQKDEKRAQRVKDAAWCNKAGALVNKFKKESGDKLVKMLMRDGENHDHIMKIAKLHDKQVKKINDIEKQADAIHNKLQYKDEG